MRFCVDLTYAAWTRAREPRAAVERTLEIARVADEAGLDSVWVSEDPEGWDAFAVLGALARETGQIRLGTGVTNPYLRHPNLLAASVATLDRLSDGRAFLGLGRGQTEWYERALGMDVGQPLAVIEETIGLLREWWEPPYRASSATAGGESHFQVREWERTVAPRQRHIPIYLGAVGPKALALAGRVANGVLFNDLASIDFIRSAVAAVREAALAAGRDPAALEFYARAGVTVTGDPGPVLERNKATIALIHALPGMDRLLEVPDFDVPSIMAKVRQSMRMDEVLATGGGFSALRRAGDLEAAKSAIPTELVARLAVVGPLPEVGARLREFVEAGVTHVFLAPPRRRQSAEEYGELVSSLAEQAQQPRS
jgi:5,10-methylenetetrahydromethanopterin reductase